MTSRPPLTRALGAHAVGTRYDALPPAVQQEAARALLNWVGVVLGGCDEDAVVRAAAFVAARGGPPQAAVIGRGLRTDPASAALVNTIASSVLAFDDAHLPSVAHPSGPAAAAVFALAQSRRVSGADLLTALALGIELQCRIANALVLPPAPLHPSFYVTGVSGPIGVAAAAGRLLGLDEQRMRWALGLAASMGAGFRATHGTMTAHFRPGHAAQCGVAAALLAEQGFDCTDDALEAPGGFFDVYASGSDLGAPLVELGTHHEMLANRYKPYPCGIVIHPVIDACQAIRARLPAGASIARIELAVHPLVLSMTAKRAPRSALESHVSVYHWAAVALLSDAPGLEATELASLADPRVMALRDRIDAGARAEFGKDEAAVSVTLADGTRLEAHVTEPRGSRARPLSDAELDQKFFALAARRLSRATAERVLAACRGIALAPDAGRALGELLP